MLSKNNSLVSKFVTIYIIITIINVTVLNIVVWENQTELIIKNASHESQYKGAGLKYIVDNQVHYTGALTDSVIQKIVDESHSLDITSIKIYRENGELLTSSESSQETSPYILRMINRAITKQSIENRIFAYKLKEKERTIDLFIPFTFDTDKQAVVYTTLRLDAIDEQMRFLYIQCILITLFIIAIHFIFGFVVSKMFLIPLKAFHPVIADISQGNFHSRVKLHGTDELGQLASSFNEMCLEITRMQDEAKGANPLTGLPGNNIISQLIDQNLKANTAFAVLYSDLDNFKAYNDKYGFTKGDDAILYTRDKLLEAKTFPGVHNIFVGHEGGDDFVVLAPYDCWETYVKHFIEIFDRDIHTFYNATDAKRRYIESVNRKGEKERFPLIGISIAGVNSVTRQFTHFGEMVKAAAELKKFVKSKDGSTYKMDERV